MAKVPGILGSKALTDELRRLSTEVFGEDEAGNPITRSQALASLVWKFALGWTEETVDGNGNKKLVEHPPVAWAMQYVWERTEGKAAQAQVEDHARVSAAAKVRELARERINKMTTIATGPPKLVKPPKGDTNE